MDVAFSKRTGAQTQHGVHMNGGIRTRVRVLGNSCLWATLTLVLRGPLVLWECEECTPHSLYQEINPESRHELVLS